MKELKIRPEAAQKCIGLTGALIQGGFLAQELDEPFLPWLWFVYLAFALVFLASIRFAFLGPAQALLFFALAATQTATSHDGLYGLAFASFGALLLFRRGCFFQNALARAIVIAGSGSALLILPVAITRPILSAIAAAVIGAAVFSIAVFCLARGRCLSALAPKKRVLKLSDYHITDRETQVVKTRLAGMSDKEIAFMLGISESRVRNLLSHAYHKLGLNGRDEFMAVGERYRIE